MWVAHTFSLSNYRLDKLNVCVTHCYYRIQCHSQMAFENWLVEKQPVNYIKLTSVTSAVQCIEEWIFKKWFSCEPNLK